MSKPKRQNQILFNMLASVASFAISICISLFITPIIVAKLGSEAYGFVSLANNFVSYATLITVALNSMESRFVSICIYRDDYQGANQYFTSVFFANILIAVVLAPIMCIAVFNLEKFLDIPAALVSDVKITFAIVFVQFLLEILTARFEIATYVTNRLNLYYINQILASAIRLLIILVGFSIFSVEVVFLVLGSLLARVYVASRNVHYTKQFLPQLKVHRKYFDFGAIKNVAASGVWNLISKLSSILLDGLDLLIANIFIGSAEMGALSLSKTIPALFTSLRGTLDYPFTPSMTECYAKGDINGVVRYARLGNKVLGVFMIAPMAVFIIYGRSFFQLWVPSQDATLLEILSLLSVMSLLAGSCINSIFTIFTIANKVKLNSLVILATGILTTITVFLLLNFTDIGVYAIAGVSSSFSLLRNYIFTPLYGAYCLGVKKSTFYKEIVTGNVCLVINCLITFGVMQIITGDSWITLILGCGISGLISVVINACIVLERTERAAFIQHIGKKIKRQ
ncbi:hypothetical protein B5G06_11815 [Flavonifractor sp. An52]|uniref:MATE family efflux transporter n=1 Tax=Flavonifractor sp. An52 TaxID=1965642 RepID=UPI000B371B94|nr:MATE family efflux transporter [Flavonifractor sp. An52]OUN80296.1 hypothetical protein B5G06_11815 [Flavonifractor sp. An52]